MKKVIILFAALLALAGCGSKSSPMMDKTFDCGGSNSVVLKKDGSMKIGTTDATYKHSKNDLYIAINKDDDEAYFIIKDNTFYAIEDEKLSADKIIEDDNVFIKCTSK